MFGLGLHYYYTIGHSDYRAIGDGVAPFAKPNNADFKSLYNGNIAGMSVNLAALGRAAEGVNAEPLFYKYRYDQLNRLVSMRAYKGFNSSTNAWTPVLLDDYREDVKYDANGNILNYIRNGSPEVPDSAKLMDSLTYKYWANTNQLKQVLDEVGYSGNYAADIDNQTETENYIYDAIGNLVQDKSENLTVAWTVYGKIKSVTKAGGTIYYTYDAAGNRISKTNDGKTTVYVRDASGNVMSIYQKNGAGALDQQELHLYGSSRLGLTGKRTADPEEVTLAMGFDPGKLITFTRGEKIFELSNHLGNVLATINDKKLATDDGNGEVAWYEADVVTANDYYPFGMIMPGRKYAFDDTYRYGFNGQERSAEIDPNGNSMTAEFWQYDARLGRRWNVDPIIKESESPYLAYSANPVLLIDPDGSDTTKPGTAVREFKSIAKNPGFGPSMSWLYNWLPENNAGDKAAAIINGVGAAASEMIEGTGNLIKDPVGSVKTAMDMGHVGEPNSTQRAYYIQFAKEYAENTTTYGSTYANYFFWSKTATEIGSTVSPIIKAFKPPGTGYTPAMAAIDYAVLESMLPNKARFRVVSAMGSEKGITLGLNGGDFPSKIHPDLGLVAVSTEKWPVLQCAEPKALNKQLLLGVPKPSVSAATFSLKSGNHYRGSFIFSDARLAYGRIVQDVQFSSGKTVAPKAPCSNCNVLLKGTNDR